jgi:DnaK suppressor protein
VAKASTKKRTLAKPAKVSAKIPARSKARATNGEAPKIRLSQKPVAPVRRGKVADIKPPSTRPVENIFVKRAAPAQKFPPPMPVILPTPIPTDGKPRKNQAGFHTKELEYYRSLLLAKRRELVGDMSSMEREALRSTSGSNLSNLPIHMADMGTDNYEQEFTLGLVEKDRQLLREINSALAKIQNGNYGICEGTGKPIGKARLEAQPWAKYSIEYARQLEKGGVRR